MKYDDSDRDKEIKYWRPHFRVNDSDGVEPKTVTMFLCRGDGKIDVVSAMGTLEGICVPVWQLMVWWFVYVSNNRLTLLLIVTVIFRWWFDKILVEKYEIWMKIKLVPFIQSFQIPMWIYTEIRKKFSGHTLSFHFYNILLKFPYWFSCFERLFITKNNKEIFIFRLSWAKARKWDLINWSLTFLETHCGVAQDRFLWQSINIIKKMKIGSGRIVLWTISLLKWAQRTEIGG